MSRNIKNNLVHIFMIVNLCYYLFPSQLFSQSEVIAYKYVPLQVESGVFNGEDIRQESENVVVFSTDLDNNDAKWMRIVFSEASLGENSYIRISSVQNGYVQTLNSKTIEEWSNTSAYFNGINPASNKSMI